MRIRKVQGHRYALSPGGIWVRDFVSTKQTGPDISNITKVEERGVLLLNRILNRAAKPNVQDMNPKKRPKVLVVSDGLGFKDIGPVLEGLPKDVYVIGVNRALSKWGADWRPMNLFLANSPYQDAMRMLWKHRNKPWPPCLVSSRVFPGFLEAYEGPLFLYEPACEENFAWRVESGCLRLDDYRNPVCAAVCLAERCLVDRLAFLCCDDSFREERAGSVPAREGHWCYPAQIVAHGVIDSMLGWMESCGREGVRFADSSHGPEYTHANYIPKEALAAFFQGEVDD